MTRPFVLSVSGPLMEWRRDWDMGYQVLGPDDIAAGLAPMMAAEIEVLVTSGEPLDIGLVAALPALKLVACFSSGYENIDLAYLRTRGIALTTAAGINAHDVADHAIALMLAWRHNIIEVDRRVREGRWRAGLFPRSSLREKTAGIVGLGRIGREVALRAQALGMHVQWWGPRPKADADYLRADSLASLARESDVLFVTSRATATNAHQINGEILSLLGDKGLLVNISRGSLIDETDLIEALESRSIAGAALDVFDPEPTDASVWSRYPNVLLSPHIAGYTQEAVDAMIWQLRENIRRHFSGEALLTPVGDEV